MCNDMYPSLQYHTKLFHCSTCALHFQPLATTNPFTTSMILPFPECHMVEIIQYVALSHWLLSLSNMLLRSLHVFLWLDSSFLFVKCENAHSYLTLLDPMDCSPLGSSIHGILQARILEWVAIPFSGGSSQPRDQTRFSRIYFYCWVIVHY